MARHQTNCHWGIEILQAGVIFAVGISIGALAAVGFWKNDDFAVLILGGLPTVILFTIGFRLCSAAFRKRRASRLGVDEEEEDGTLQGISSHGPQRNQQRGSIQLPATAVAQLEQLSSAKADGVYNGGGGGGGAECVVCLGEVGDDGLPTRQLPACRHVFHKRCIEQWLLVHPTCPICRCNARQESLEVILRLNT